MNFDFIKFMFAGDDNSGVHIGDTRLAPMTVINPSTVLPMLDDRMGGVDVGGSLFGMDVHSIMSDSFTTGMDSNLQG
jgi:hypothetical protein